MKSQKDQKNKNISKDTNMTTGISLGLAIGLSLGVLFGIVTDNIGHLARRCRRSVRRLGCRCAERKKGGGKR